MLDVLLPEPTLDMDAILNQGLDLSQNVSRFQDITMQEHSALHFEQDEDIGLAFDLALEHTALPEDGWRLDLGADVELGRRDDTDMSIEVGRDANMSNIEFNPDVTIGDKNDVEQRIDFTFEDPMQQEGGYGNDEMVMDFPEIQVDREQTPIPIRIIDQGKL